MNYTNNTIRYRESDYLYGTARIRALEKKLLSQTAIARAMEAADEEGAISVLHEFGIEIDPKDIEKSLSELLGEAIRECEAASPDSSVFGILRYPYDVHNIKAVIKCDIRGVSPDSLLSEAGSVPTDEVKKMPLSGSWSLFPANMEKAAKQAIDDFAVNHDPQMLDSTLDKACFADMTALAKKIKDSFFAKWASVRADIVNILTCVRIMRMTGDEEDTLYLQNMLVPGGKLRPEFFTECLGDGETALWKNVAITEYAPIVAKIDSEGALSLSAIEKICDNFCLETAKSQKTVLSSAGALAGYIIAVEYMLKDIRILLAGKKAGLSAETLKERLRDTYV